MKNLYESINNVLNGVEIEEGVGNNAIVKRTKNTLKQASSSVRGAADYLHDAADAAYLDSKLVSNIEKVMKTLKIASKDIESIARKVKA